MYTTTKFTEWLIQQGLIRSEQICQTHLNNDLSVVKLKLGMYSDISKFPYSGGYVWISDCCPSQFVSVSFTKCAMEIPKHKIKNKQNKSFAAFRYFLGLYLKELHILQQLC